MVVMGENLVTLKGTVKGVDLLATMSFSASQTIHVVTEGCSNPQ
jgi:hypothetical protein